MNYLLRRLMAAKLMLVFGLDCLRTSPAAFFQGGSLALKMWFSPRDILVERLGSTLVRTLRDYPLEGKELRLFQKKPETFATWALDRTTINLWAVPLVRIDIIDQNVGPLVRQWHWKLGHLSDPEA